MIRFLEVTSEADSLQLLTIAEMRVAAGLESTDTSQDTALNARGLAVAANITSECNVAVGAGFDPTLNQETLRETIYNFRGEQLVLSRRHNVTITSITADGSLLDAEDYFVNTETGIITLLSDDTPIRWCYRKIVVVYVAGFEEVPPSLKQAASDYFRAMTLETARDPYVKSETIDVVGVEVRTTDLWAGTLPGAPTIPAIVSGQLTRFRNTSSF